jgi:hypothetical protein
VGLKRLDESLVHLKKTVEKGPMKILIGNPTLACAFLAAAVLTAATDLKAGDIEMAKEHFEKGKILVEEGAFAKAVVELKRSYELNALPIVLYNIAVCYDTLQRYALALHYYEYYLQRETDLEEEKKTEVLERISRLEKLIGRLEIEANVKGADVLVDGSLFGYTPVEVVAIETGEHTLTLSKTGYEDVSRNFTIVSGETTHVKLVMSKTFDPCLEAPGNAPAHATQDGGKKGRMRKIKPAAFWTSLGLTLAVTAGLVVTGSLALEKSRQVSDMTDETDDWKDVRDEGRKLATATDVLLGAAVLGGVTTIFIAFFTDFKKTGEKPSGLSTALSGGGALLQYEWRF